MTEGSICTGIDGIGLGLRAVTEARTAWMCEHEPNLRGALAERHGAPVYADVRTTDWGAVEPVDIITAGYPCQPFSLAGLRKGTNDDRHLWPFVADAIRRVGPRYVLLENVRGHLTLGFDRVLGDLADLGFDARWGLFRASDVGAPHQRARLFILARHPDRARREQGTGLRQGDPIEDGHVATGADRSAADTCRSAFGPEPVGVDGRGGAMVAGLDGEAAADADEGRRVINTEQYGDATHATEGHDEHRHEPARRGDDRGRPHMGRYEAAVGRWEAIHGPAPHPLADGRLNPAFVEWMMGFPPGWTSELPRTQALAALGNAVVPHVAALAWRELTDPVSP